MDFTFRFTPLFFLLLMLNPHAFSEAIVQFPFQPWHRRLMQDLKRNLSLSNQRTEYLKELQRFVDSNLILAVPRHHTYDDG